MHDERMDSGGGVRRRRSGEGDDDEPLLDWIIEDSVIVDEDSVMIVVSTAGLTVGLTVFFFLDFAAFLLALDGPGIFNDDSNQTRTVTVTRQLNSLPPPPWTSTRTRSLQTAKMNSTTTTPQVLRRSLLFSLVANPFI